MRTIKVINNSNVAKPVKLSTLKVGDWFQVYPEKPETVFGQVSGVLTDDNRIPCLVLAHGISEFKIRPDVDVLKLDEGTLEITIRGNAINAAPKKIVLNESHIAELTPNGVVVGCQTFPFEKVEELAKAAAAYKKSLTA